MKFVPGRTAVSDRIACAWAFGGSSIRKAEFVFVLEGHARIGVAQWAQKPSSTIPGVNFHTQGPVPFHAVILNTN